MSPLLVFLSVLALEGSMIKIQLLLLVVLASSSVSAWREQSSTQKRLITLKGRVVDARTGEPIAKVRVIANGVDQSTTTDDNGAFSFENLPGGPLDLYITTVSYGLVKKTITLKDGENRDFVIALNEDAAA